VVGKGLTVRQTESLVRRLQRGGTRRATPGALDPNVRSLQDDLSQRLGAQVAIRHGAGGRGKLVISYNSLDELDGILGHIK
jgi:ParB family chromosome partitioning protein